MNEGLARALSQAVVYGMERHKVCQQITIAIATRHMKKTRIATIQGALTSSVLSGIVFASYFSIYNVLKCRYPLIASPVASCITSFIKIPIGNGMRILQAGKAVDFLHAVQQLHAKRGLYSGYGIALVEDIIEFDLRNRIYDTVTSACHNHKNKNKHTYESTIKRNTPTTSESIINICVGIASCSIAAAVTTPSDVIRLHMCMNQTRARHTASMLLSANGLGVFYRGAGMRGATNATKSAAYFIFYELLMTISKNTKPAQ